MFIEKYRPVWDEPDETGADVDQDTPDTTESEGEADGDRLSGASDIRKSLTKGFKDAAKASETPEKDKKTGKFKSKEKRIAGGAVIQDAGEAPAASNDTATTEDVDDDAPVAAAPEAFSKEAKAAWAQVPPIVQAAILKRETDTARGVEELKGKYKDLDQAIAPHLEAIRRNGHTPAQAVNQLFAWMQALAGNPDAAFPALAKSFGYDLARFLPKDQTPAAQPAAAAPVAGQEEPAYVVEMRKQLQELGQYVNQNFQRMGQTHQQEIDARTNTVIKNWAQNKPHFESVRKLMANLIQSGEVPLKDGEVDLDTAYEMAVYANPAVRAQVQAEQQAARKAERDRKAAEAAAVAAANAAKAKKTAVSVTGGPPGNPAAQPTAKKGRGKSIRESIMEAREALSE